MKEELSCGHRYIMKTESCSLYLRVAYNTILFSIEEGLLNYTMLRILHEWQL